MKHALVILTLLGSSFITSAAKTSVCSDESEISLIATGPETVNLFQDPLPNDVPEPDYSQPAKIISTLKKCEAFEGLKLDKQPITVKRWKTTRIEQEAGSYLRTWIFSNEYKSEMLIQYSSKLVTVP